MIRDLDDLNHKLNVLTQFYAIRNANIEAWRNMVFMKPESIWKDANGDYIKPEPDEIRIMLPIAWNTIEGYRELLLTKPPSISVPEPTIKGEASIAADYNEKVLHALWSKLNIYDRLRDSLWHALTDSWGVLQMVWVPGREDFPLQVLHHDPFNVYPMPGDLPGTWNYVIHSYPRLVGSIREEFSQYMTDRRSSKSKTYESAFEGLDDTEEVVFIDYWDKDVNAIGIQFDKRVGKTVTSACRWVKKPTPHGYGFLPWEIYIPCRLPFTTEGQKFGVSILYPLEDLIPVLDRFISAKATMLNRWEDPPLITETDLGEDFNPVRSEAGMHLKLRTGEKAYYLVHPGAPPQVDSLIAFLGEHVEVSALPRVLQGLYVGDVSGIAMSLLRNPTLMKVAFKQKEIERAAMSLNTKMLKLLEKKLTGKHYLWSDESASRSIDIELDRSKIGGYYRNVVKLSASLPTDDANIVNMLIALTQSQILSRKTARDVAQQSLHDLVPQSVIDEEKNILAEQIWNDPGTVQSLAQQAAEEISMPYLKKQENPKGGYGDKEITMPGKTLPSQLGAMPGGNTQPSMSQSLQEMTQRAPLPVDTGGILEEMQ